MTRREVWYIPDGYDRDTKDDCTEGYTGPKVTLELIKKAEKESTDKTDDKEDTDQKTAGVIGATLRVTVTKGTGNPKTYQLLVDGKVVKSGNIPGTTFDPGYTTTGTEKVIKVIVTDDNDYESSAQVEVK